LVVITILSTFNKARKLTGSDDLVVRFLFVVTNPEVVSKVPFPSRGRACPRPVTALVAAQGRYLRGVRPQILDFGFYNIPLETPGSQLMDNLSFRDSYVDAVRKGEVVTKVSCPKSKWRQASLPDAFSIDTYGFRAETPDSTL